MTASTLSQTLISRPYPGRGILAARLGSGQRCLAYFLTGRSAASRTRDLAVLENKDVAVSPTGADAGPDHLRHYVAVARRDGVIVVGNGNQVEPVADALMAGDDPLSASPEQTYEPDPPIFTPRIWVSTRVDEPAPWVFGLAARSARPGGGTDRVAWKPDTVGAGEGVLLSTYDGTVEAVRTCHLPVDVVTSATTLQEVLTDLWNALDPNLRVAALAFDPGDLTGSLQARRS